MPYHLSDLLNSLTYGSPPEIENKDSKAFFIQEIFDAAASIYPLKDSLLLLMDHEDRIRSIVYEKDNCKDSLSKGRTLSLSKSSKPRHEIYMRFDEAHLYLLKNIPSDFHGRFYSILLITLADAPSAFKDLNRMAEGFEKLHQYDSKRHAAYEKLLDYLDAIDDGVSACDENGIVTFINTSACDMIGGTKAEIIGKSLFHPPFKDTILTQVIQTGKPSMDFEYNLFYKGKRNHLMNSAYPVLNNRGEIKGAIDIFRRIQRSYKIASDMAGHRASFEFGDFIGNSPALQNKINLAKEFSKINKNTLIEGESGTGKELFSQAIHNYSDRKNGPFVAINCANFPTDLIDSELFGYDEGAFTGAKKGGKSGKFELADGGTLFLDEIGEMPMQLQSKLLRVIETKQITRLGSNKAVNIDVRIIAATNRDLETMVGKNQFREDLYYRLRVLYLKLPPLRERSGDIEVLCKHFIEKINTEMDRPVAGLSDDAFSLIRSFPWPGNIRQLENVLSIAMFLCSEEILQPRHLIQAGLEASPPIQPQTRNMADSNRRILEDALRQNEYNIKKTSEALGISRNTIYRKMKKYKIKTKD